MDAQAKQKAFFRAKLNAQKQEKQRIDSPVVRYNEHDQPVCRVCDVVIKSELLWPAHQASRKHHDSIEKLKANAAAVTGTNNSTPAKELPKPKSESSKELPKPKHKSTDELNDKSESSSALPVHHSSNLPPDFFDIQESKRPKTGRDYGSKNVPAKTQAEETHETHRSSTAMTPKFQATKDYRLVATSATASGAKQVKGALPEGFFDDKDSDLRARGITPVKPDVKDEYKEFEKLIQEDLKEVDTRLEEEEYDAAEMIEEEETVEQRAHKDRLEMLRNKKLELRAYKSTGATKNTESTHKESNHPDSSSDDDEDDESFKVDWRSKHL